MARSKSNSGRYPQRCTNCNRVRRNARKAEYDKRKAEKKKAFPLPNRMWKSTQYHRRGDYCINAPSCFNDAHGGACDGCETFAPVFPRVDPERMGYWA